MSMCPKAVFLDRDDTVIHDTGYISEPGQVKLITGVPHALWQLKKMGFLVIIVSNQSGVARGLITIEQLEEVHRRMNDLLASEGVYPDGLYYCPYHPEGTVEPYNHDSDLRKPKPGMLLLAAKEKQIDLSQSWMVGDSYRDIAAGQAAGCHTILVDVPGKPRVKQADEPEPERKAVNLREAVNIIRMYEFHQKIQKAKETAQEKKSGGDEAVCTAILPEPENLMQPEEPAAKQTEELAAAPAIEEPATMSTIKTKEDVPAAEATPLLRDLEHAGDTEPAVPHAHTFKKPLEAEAAAEKKEPATVLLEEILQQLKSAGREGLYREFSIFKLIAMLLQMLSVFCLIASVGYWLSANGSYARTFLMLGYTIALQLLVIALMMMNQND